jgi:hypothetical protein
MADGTEVEPAQLITFSGQVSEAVGPFTTSLGNALQDIAEGGAKLGVTNTPEAASVRLYHSSVVQQTTQYVGEAATGVQALSHGALTIAANYLAADADQARGMSTVNDAFAPQPGQASLSRQQAAARAAAGARDAGYAEQIAANRGTLPPSQAAADRIPAAVLDEETASDRAERVAEDIEAYSGDEQKWAGSVDEELLTEGTPYERAQAAHERYQAAQG